MLNLKKVGVSGRQQLKIDYGIFGFNDILQQTNINLIEVELRSIGLETAGNSNMVEPEKPTASEGDVHGLSYCVRGSVFS